MSLGPIAYPWTLAIAGPDQCFRPIVPTFVDDGSRRYTWDSREKAVCYAIRLSLLKQDGEFVRAVPVPITGQC